MSVISYKTVNVAKCICLFFAEIINPLNHGIWLEKPSLDTNNNALALETLRCGAHAVGVDLNLACDVL